MADQTVKIQNDDVAATAWAMAQRLWISQYDASPKASDAKFMALTAICTSTLMGRKNAEGAEAAVKKLFAQ